jgi:hypothetical protein
MVQCDREPAAAGQDPEKTRGRQQEGAAQPQPADERRADERKQVSRYRVRVVVVNLEERFDIRQAFTTDDGKRNVERMIGSGDRILRRDQLDARVADEKCVGTKPGGEGYDNRAKNGDQ